MLKLYEIDEQIEILLSEIYAIAEENDGEFPERLDVALDDLKLQKEKKALDIARYIKSMKAEADEIKFEIDKLNSRRKSLTNYVQRLRTYLLMNLHTGEKFKDANTLISWRKSEAVNVFDPDAVPDEFCKIKREPQLLIIKRNLKAGSIIDGVKLVENNNLLIK